ncbi:hypothetical protein M422DRAFT_266769 [Sphaerobolus stellatus SS14]|uniref:Uncharacterized protein n=1 Tax=Sphaerobolus stellatus (strain SS14) TaxID=990650 RepID=A0A0C9V1S1_SPHS4|nr:hypothetical protein M422DRAFT_266769 [Sphaerobolus stellatus SS14]
MVGCQLELLRKYWNTEQVERTLSSFPSTLDETCRLALLYISKKVRIWSARLLVWLLLAEYPFSIPELAEITVFSPGCTDTLEDHPQLLDPHMAIMEHCSMLRITAKEKDTSTHLEIVMLSPYTDSEYFT